jgi:hypothetical protein
VLGSRELDHHRRATGAVEPEPRADWTTSPIAQLRRDAQGAWSLLWRGSDERWHLYEDVEPTRNIQPLLAEIDADPTGIFWG